MLIFCGSECIIDDIVVQCIFLKHYICNIMQFNFHIEYNIFELFILILSCSMIYDFQLITCTY